MTYIESAYRIKVHQIPSWSQRRSERNGLLNQNQGRRPLRIVNNKCVPITKRVACFTGPSGPSKLAVRTFSSGLVFTIESKTGLSTQAPGHLSKRALKAVSQARYEAPSVISQARTPSAPFQRTICTIASIASCSFADTCVVRPGKAPGLSESACSPSKGGGHQ